MTIVLAVVGLMGAASHEIAYDDKTSDIAAVFDQSETWTQAASYIGMALVGLVLFFGAAVRNVLKVAGRSWYADVTFLGFGALGATFASWTVTDAALGGPSTTATRARSVRSPPSATRDSSL